MNIVEGKPGHAIDILQIRRQVRVATYAGYAPGITTDYIDELNQVTPELIEAEDEKLADDHYEYWLVQDDGISVGYQKVEGAPRQSINFLHLLPSHQGQGVGSKLVRLAIGWFQPGEAFVEITEGNERARRIYERFGWRSTGEWVDSLPIPGGGYLREEVMVQLLDANQKV